MAVGRPGRVSWGIPRAAWRGIRRRTRRRTRAISCPSMLPIRFDAADVARFSAFSRDRNPMHIDADYARRTPFGEPVVFGMLGVLAGLGRLAERSGYVLSAVAAEFPAPMFVGVEYDVSIDEPSPERATIALHDGRRMVLRLAAD